MVDVPVRVKDVKCGLDGSMFLTSTGTLLACGRYVSSMYSVSVFAYICVGYVCTCVRICKPHIVVIVLQQPI